jgi:hypothetical protein
LPLSRGERWRRRFRGKDGDFNSEINESERDARLDGHVGPGCQNRAVLSESSTGLMSRDCHVVLLERGGAQVNDGDARPLGRS